MLVIDSWFDVFFNEQEHCKDCFEVQNRELTEVWKYTAQTIHSPERFGECQDKNNHR